MIMVFICQKNCALDKWNYLLVDFKQTERIGRWTIITQMGEKTLF